MTGPYAYALLHDLDDGENIALRRLSGLELDPFAGRPMGDAVEQPVRFALEAGEDDCYAQYDPDFEGRFEPRSVEERLKASYEDFSVMSGELVEALGELGVNNLEVFDAEVREVETGARLPRPYVFVNILGRLDCATRLEVPGADAHPSSRRTRIVIHPEETEGLSLFRLARTPSQVVVSARVAAVANDPQMRGLRAFPLESAPRGEAVD